MKWKKISSKEIYKNRWIRLVEDRVKTDTGKELTFGVVHKDPFALIIPWDGKLTLVGQYRYSVNEFSWEFPQGHFQNNSIVKTAREELKEETGLVAKRIKKIQSFNLGAGLPCSQKCHVFLATGLSQGEKSLEDSEEDMKMIKITKNQFVKMMKDGEIKDGPTLIAFAIATMYKLL